MMNGNAFLAMIESIIILSTLMAEEDQVPGRLETDVGDPGVKRQAERVQGCAST